MKTVFSKTWEKSPQPVGPTKTRRRSTSRENRASTRTKASSLEKMQQTDSIKMNKSLFDTQDISRE